MRSRTTRRLVISALVALIVGFLVRSGWADDKAKPGSRGRVQVTPSTSAEPSRPQR